MTKHKPTCATEAKKDCAMIEPDEYDRGFYDGLVQARKSNALLAEACHALRELMCRGADDAGSPEIALAKAVLLKADAILYK